MKKNMIFAGIVLLLIVSLGSCGKKSTTEPEPKPEPTIILSPQAVELTEDAIHSIVAMDSSGTITFSQKTKELESLQAGNVIAGDTTPATPYGFLKKVKEITVNGSSVIVKTSSATLEDIFSKASISIRDTLTIDDLKLEKSHVRKGVSLRKATGTGFYLDISDVVLYDRDKDDNTTWDQIRANGSLEITPVFQFSFALDNLTLKELRFVFAPTATQSLELTCGTGLEFEPEYKLAEYSFTPIVVWVAWVPIVIYPVLEIFVGADVAVTLECKAEIGQEATIEAGLEYKSSQWTPISTFNTDLSYTFPRLTSSLSARGYIGPRLKLLFYGIDGPYADLRGYLELDADISEVPWWELYAGIEVGVGVKVEVLSTKVADYYAPSVIGYRQLLAQADSAYVDTIPPSAIADLLALNPYVNSMTLQWTAPGDDGSVGQANQYDIRYATFLINEFNWGNASRCEGEPSPKTSGANESFTVTGLSPSTPYYFSIKTADEHSNWSALSNNATATTESDDNTPPAAVVDLAAINPTGNSMTLTWTAPGDDGDVGTGFQYEIRYAPFIFNEATWSAGTKIWGVPSPKPAGEAESFTIAGLSCGIRYYAALKTRDEKSNWSPMSNMADNQTLTTGCWSSIGRMSNNVEALAIFNGQLIAAGFFRTAGGVPANYIAAWDGGSWSPLGSGMNDFVHALTVYDGKLIAAGRFTTAGGVSATRVASWNGSSWSPLDAGLGEWVYALTVYNGQLIAGGMFGVAAWNGSSWSPLYSGSEIWVWDLAVYNNELVVGGTFVIPGSTYIYYIARWNGTHWSPLGTGMSGGGVYGLGLYGAQLVAGGYFTAAGGVSADHVAAWNGSSWFPLGSGVNEVIYAFTVYNGRLIAGGSFGIAGGVPAQAIAAWNGSSWSPLGTGFSGNVAALAVYNGSLIVGGYSESSGNIASYRD